MTDACWAGDRGDDATERMALVTLAVGGWDRRDEVERFDGTGVFRDARLVARQVAPEHGGELNRQPPRDLSVEPLVARQSARCNCSWATL